MPLLCTSDLSGVGRKTTVNDFGTNMDSGEDQYGELTLDHDDRDGLAIVRHVVRVRARRDDEHVGGRALPPCLPDANGAVAQHLDPADAGHPCGLVVAMMAPHVQALDMLEGGGVMPPLAGRGDEDALAPAALVHHLVARDHCIRRGDGGGRRLEERPEAARKARRLPHGAVAKTWSTIFGDDAASSVIRGGHGVEVSDPAETIVG